MFFIGSFCGYFPARENQTVFVLTMPALQKATVIFPKRQHRFAIHAPIVGICRWKDAKIRHIFPLNVVQMYRVSDRRGVTNVATILK